MSLFESFKRLLLGGGQNGRSAGTNGSGSSGAFGETAVATIPCEEACARLFEYLDGELEGVSEEEVRRHLEVCKVCYPRVQFEKHFLEALRGSRNGGGASASLRERVLEALAREERQD